MTDSFCCEAQSRDELCKYLYSSRSVIECARQRKIGRRANVHADANRHPVESRFAPPGLDKNSRELPALDEKIVRPFQPHRLGSEAVERAGRAKSYSKGKHIEARRISRSLDECQPDSRCRGRGPFSAGATASCSLLVRIPQSARRTPCIRFPVCYV